jgi:hypothetical protein
MTTGEFSVCQFFADGTHDYEHRFVDAATAVHAFASLTWSVGARIGTTVRVIITDAGDCINKEWEYGKGLTYPTPEMIQAHEAAERS